MNFKKLTAFFMALMTCAAIFTGCGDEDDDEPTSKKSSKKKSKSSVVISETTDSFDDDEESSDIYESPAPAVEDEDEDETESKTEGKTKPVTEDETEPETEEKLENIGDTMGYDENAEKFKLLSKSWVEDGCSCKVAIGDLENIRGIHYKDYIIFWYNTKKNGMAINRYDLNTKELVILPKMKSVYFFRDGYFYGGTYDFSNKEGMTGAVYKYDLDGELVASYEGHGINGSNILDVADDGTLFVVYKDDNIAGSGSDTAMLSPDLKKLTPIPRVTYKNSHGFTETMDAFEAKTEYKGILYANSKNGYVYGYDYKNDEWKKLYKGNVYHSYFDKTNNGNYTGSDGSLDANIYDIETGEKIIEGFNPYRYEHGLSAYYIQMKESDSDDKLYWYRYTSFDDIVQLKDMEKLGGYDNDPGDKFLIDDEHYLLKDNYGIFLRTYAKGKDEEEVICYLK